MVGYRIIVCLLSFAVVAVRSHQWWDIIIDICNVTIEIPLNETLAAEDASNTDLSSQLLDVSDFGANQLAQRPNFADKFCYCAIEYIFNGKLEWLLFQKCLQSYKVGMTITDDNTHTTALQTTLLSALTTNLAMENSDVTMNSDSIIDLQLIVESSIDNIDGSTSNDKSNHKLSIISVLIAVTVFTAIVTLILRYLWSTYRWGDYKKIQNAATLHSLSNKPYQRDNGGNNGGAYRISLESTKLGTNSNLVYQSNLMGTLPTISEMTVLNTGFQSSAAAQYTTEVVSLDKWFSPKRQINKNTIDEFDESSDSSILISSSSSSDSNSSSNSSESSSGNSSGVVIDDSSSFESNGEHSSSSSVIVTDSDSELELETIANIEATMTATTTAEMDESQSNRVVMVE